LRDGPARFGHVVQGLIVGQKFDGVFCHCVDVACLSEVTTLSVLDQFRNAASSILDEEVRSNSRVYRLPGVDSQTKKEPPESRKAEPESKKAEPESRKAEPVIRKTATGAKAEFFFNAAAPTEKR